MSEEDPLQNIVEAHILCSGLVQGVGFRATTRLFASSLGLKGTVRNLPNGQVEIYAQGHKNAVKQLLEQLDKQFPQSQSTLIKTYHPIELFLNFDIIF